MTSSTASGTIAFNRSLALQRLLLDFTANLVDARPPKDGLLTARFVGEFSAGKTRLLGELFGELIPPALFPISSLERQTRLPLEITYGDAPALSLIEREHDYSDAVILDTFAHFPERQELAHLDPMKHRLRLTLDEPRLILAEGDRYGEDNSPKRLFLIDTPGWNSGDDAIAEQSASSLMLGLHNLAVVYVCQAARLDGETNAEHLRDFMSALNEAATDFLGQARLLMVVTACPPQQAAKFEQSARSLALRLWQELDQDPDDLELDIFCVDFKDLPRADLQHFRQRFWDSLLAPLGPDAARESGDPCAAAIRRWPADWDLLAPLRESARLLQRGQQLLERSRVGGEYVVGMNMYRLLGLKPAELREKVRKTWLRQLDCDVETLADWSIPALPEGHPLGQWWEHYWQLEMNRLIGPIRKFFVKAQQAIKQLTPDTADLQQYLQEHLERHHALASARLGGSFACLMRGLPALYAEPAAERRVATLLSLSLLQSRYEDYYLHHQTVVADAV